MGSEGKGDLARETAFVTESETQLNVRDGTLGWAILHPKGWKPQSVAQREASLSLMANELPLNSFTLYPSATAYWGSMDDATGLSVHLHAGEMSQSQTSAFVQMEERRKYLECEQPFFESKHGSSIAELLLNAKGMEKQHQISLSELAESRSGSKIMTVHIPSGFRLVAPQTPRGSPPDEAERTGITREPFTVDDLAVTLSIFKSHNYYHCTACQHIVFPRAPSVVETSSQPGEEIPLLEHTLATGNDAGTERCCSVM